MLFMYWNFIHYILYYTNVDHTYYSKCPKEKYKYFVGVNKWLLPTISRQTDDKRPRYMCHWIDIKIGREWCCSSEKEKKKYLCKMWLLFPVIYLHREFFHRIVIVIYSYFLGIVVIPLFPLFESLFFLAFSFRQNIQTPVSLVRSF